MQSKMPTEQDSKAKSLGSSSLLLPFDQELSIVCRSTLFTPGSTSTSKSQQAASKKQDALKLLFVLLLLQETETGYQIKDCSLGLTENLSDRFFGFAPSLESNDFLTHTTTTFIQSRLIEY